MPPVGGKGKGKGSRDHRRSISRNTTPSSIGTSIVQASIGGPTNTAYLELPVADLIVSTKITYEDLLDRIESGTGIPNSKHLESLAEDLRTLSANAEIRGFACDKGMRELAARRKRKDQEDRERDRLERSMEEKEKMRREALAEDEEEELRGRKVQKIKKRKETSKTGEERPPTHGSHVLARQDGVQQDGKGINMRKSGSSPNKVKREPPSISQSSQSPASLPKSPAAAPVKLDPPSEPGSPVSSNGSLSSHQPPPVATIPHYQAFGPDPSTFPDSTIYHIRDIKPGMSEDEIKEIYSVASYPNSDLHDLIPGIPPEKDFSNAKPTNQVSFNTFQTYIEPYFRPFSEEDLAFLRERGDRTTPFVIPRRGKKHYTDVWAEEDGAMSIDSPQQSSFAGSKLPANQPRGNIDQLNDDTAETDQVSTGPMLARLLSAMRPESRLPPSEDKVMTNGIGNGEPPIVGINGDINIDGEPNGGEERPAPIPSAAFIPDSAQPGWKISTAKLDYAQVDERLKQELRYIGFVGEEQEPDYDAHYDDEIAARLRYLQDKLKQQSILNGARKARIADVVRDRMAHQEYTTIAEDLDNQVQQAYLKRTRTMGKSKKHKRPGGAGGGSHYVGPAAGVMKPGIGDVTKTLMDRRKKWSDFIGPVLEDVSTTIPNESIFKREVMQEHMEKEREAWDEEGED
ncbi:MAG: Transcriptional regulator [Trichoglossum hirsutum]|nr:MAG: Transcriptional regulator [Trichoglossum hirsutum]